MNRTPRIMTDLHYISDKIAEQARNNSGANADELNPPSGTHTPAINPLPQTSSQSAGSQARKTEQKTSVKVEESDADQDGQYLKTCNAYYNNARKVLLERTVALSALLEERKRRFEAETAGLASSLNELNAIQDQLSKVVLAKSRFDSVSECEASSSALEHLQLQYARLRAASEDVSIEKNDPSPQQTSPVSGDFFASMLKSLSFGQLSRLGCCFGFAYIVALLLLGIVLAVAIIGAMKGYF